MGSFHGFQVMREQTGESMAATWRIYGALLYGHAATVRSLKSKSQLTFILASLSLMSLSQQYPLTGLVLVVDGYDKSPISIMGASADSMAYDDWGRLAAHVLHQLRNCMQPCAGMTVSKLQAANKHMARQSG